MFSCLIPFPDLQHNRPRDNRPGTLNLILCRQFFFVCLFFSKFYSFIVANSCWKRLWGHKRTIHIWSQSVNMKALFIFTLCPSLCSRLTCPLTSALLWCSQGPLARSGLMSVNHSHVTMVAVAITTSGALHAPAFPVSKDTIAKSTLMSAKSSHAKMGLCV